MKSLNYMTLGELAALYILIMRGVVKSEYSLADIQNQMEALAGDLATIEAIRNVRIAIDAA